MRQVFRSLLGCLGVNSRLGGGNVRRQGFARFHINELVQKLWVLRQDLLYIRNGCLKTGG
jgi:hypothetical protein